MVRGRRRVPRSPIGKALAAFVTRCSSGTLGHRSLRDEGCGSLAAAVTTLQTTSARGILDTKSDADYATAFNQDLGGSVRQPRT